MKKQTLRGVLPRYALTIPNVGDDIQVYRLNLNNSDINRNWKVTKFEVFPNMGVPWGLYNQSIGPELVFVTLCLDEDGATAYGSFGDNRQIGWVACTSSSSPIAYRSYTDLNHVVVNDLYLGVWTIDTSDGAVDPTHIELNYVVEIEEVKSTDEEAIIQLIRERSQTDME